MTFISGINPKLAVSADLTPVRSECAVGAMMAWADKLWFVTFVGHTGRSGSGTGLYSLDADFNMEKHPESVVGTYANRWIHSATDQVCLGPHLIHADGTVRTVPALVDHRLTATMDHHEDIVNKVSYLTMEGLILELDLRTLEVKTAFNLMKEFSLPPGKQPHFKGAYCNNGEIIVANNSFDEPDYRGEWTGGLLAEYKDGEWSILEKTGSLEIYGRRNFGNIVYATGWDRKSCYLRVKQNGAWRKYRLPKSSATYEHMWNTEWTRIRELEHERYIADVHGGFFELPTTNFLGTTIVRPISTHLRCVTDITMFKGLVVMGSNQLSPHMELDWWRDDRSENEGVDTGTAMDLSKRLDNNPTGGESQVGLWFGHLEELWSYGKPKGWGAVWLEEDIEEGTVSDPYLMTGYDKKCLHLRNHGDQPMEIAIELDALGNGAFGVWRSEAVESDCLSVIDLSGINAHWIRVTSRSAGNASALLHYS